MNRKLLFGALIAVGAGAAFFFMRKKGAGAPASEAQLPATASPDVEPIVASGTALTTGTAMPAPVKAPSIVTTAPPPPPPTPAVAVKAVGPEYAAPKGKEPPGAPSTVTKAPAIVRRPPSKPSLKQAQAAAALKRRQRPVARS